jgi:hypothetical protein
MRQPIKKQHLIDLLKMKLKDDEKLYIDFNTRTNSDILMQADKIWPVALSNDLILEVVITVEKEFGWEDELP